MAGFEPTADNLANLDLNVLWILCPDQLHNAVTPIDKVKVSTDMLEYIVVQARELSRETSGISHGRP